MAVSTLILNSPLLQIAAKRAVLRLAVQKSVRECKEEVRQTSIRSVPQGKVNKRGHRASRSGQPPAVEFGVLVNTIEAKNTGEFSGTVRPTAKYAARLENQMNRKFVAPAAKKYEPKFQQNIRKVFIP